MTSGWAPRPWDEPNMRVTLAGRVIAEAAWNLWRGPLGSGWLWILVLLAELGVSGRALWRRGFQPVPYLTAMLAAAGLCYVWGFAIVGVADELRYLHPVFLLGIMGVPLAVSCVQLPASFQRFLANATPRVCRSESDEKSNRPA